MKGLIVPGLNGSGPKHWQTLWEERYGFERVVQRDWGNPSADEWVQTLDAAIVKHAGKVALIAHSLGCWTVVRWSVLHPDRSGRVNAALLVTPPDDVASLPESARRFITMKPGQLPFPSILVGSENDPYMAPARIQALSLSFGSSFMNSGLVGHINVDSGHGEWLQGESLLHKLGCI